MRSLVTFFFVFLILTTNSLPSESAEKLNLINKGAIGKDDRKPMDSWDKPWNAVGRIFVQGFRKINGCSGTLVHPKIVATAAHCLFDPVSSKLVPPESVHFLAGWRFEKYLGHSTAECLKVHPDLKDIEILPWSASERDLVRIKSGTFNSRAFVQKVTRVDAAFVVLKQAIEIPVVPIHNSKYILESDILVHAGYGSDRKYLLSVHDGCRAKIKSDNVYYIDCDTNRGQSGGPVFVRRKDKYYMAAILSSGAALFFDSEGRALGLNSAVSVMEMRDQLEEIKQCPK